MLIYEVSEEESSDFLAFFALGFLGLGSLAVRQVVLVVFLDLFKNLIVYILFGSITLLLVT